MMLLAFTLDDWRCALELSTIQRVYRAVAVTPLPGAPDIVQGIVNVRGVVLPVLNIRLRFNLQVKQLNQDDWFIIAYATGRLVALVVDDVSGVFECSEKDITSVSAIVPHVEYIEGVVQLKDGMILIHDLARFLSLDEKVVLEQALEAMV